MVVPDLLIVKRTTGLAWGRYLRAFLPAVAGCAGMTIVFLAAQGLGVHPDESRLLFLGLVIMAAAVYIGATAGLFPHVYRRAWQGVSELAIRSPMSEAPEPAPTKGP